MRLIQKKICLLGDFSVGKTSLVRRYVEGRFDDKYLSTIGVKVSRKLLDKKDFQLNLIIWDLAGGNEFSGHDKNYLRGASGALLVFDVTRPETLEILSAYVQQMNEINPNAAMVVAANKADLLDGNIAQISDLEVLCQSINSQYVLTSAKTGENVEEVTLMLVEMMMSRSDFFAQ